LVATDNKKTWSVLVTGGAGYVGSVLVPKLLAEGHNVAVLDLFMYGEDLFRDYREHPRLREIKGDLRDPAAVRNALWGCDAVIHLACISNDPSFELDPELGRSINYDTFRPLVRAAKAAGVTRFIYASSSSVYGIKDEPEVTEELSLEPLTDYSKYKALCETVLQEERAPGFVTCILRPATVLRLCAAPAPRRRRQYPDQPGGQYPPHQGLGRHPEAPPTSTSRTWRASTCSCCSSPTTRSTARFSTPASRTIP